MTHRRRIPRDIKLGIIAGLLALGLLLSFWPEG